MRAISWDETNSRRQRDTTQRRAQPRKPAARPRNRAAALRNPATGVRNAAEPRREPRQASRSRAAPYRSIGAARRSSTERSRDRGAADADPPCADATNRRGNAATAKHFANSRTCRAASRDLDEAPPNHDEASPPHDEGTRTHRTPPRSRNEGSVTVDAAPRIDDEAVDSPNAASDTGRGVGCARDEARRTRNAPMRQANAARGQRKGWPTRATGNQRPACRFLRSTCLAFVTQPACAAQAAWSVFYRVPAGPRRVTSWRGLCRRSFCRPWRRRPRARAWSRS